jgi:hypothetical protein
MFDVNVLIIMYEYETSRSNELFSVRVVLHFGAVVLSRTDCCVPSQIGSRALAGRQTVAPSQAKSHAFPNKQSPLPSHRSPSVKTSYPLSCLLSNQAPGVALTKPHSSLLFHTSIQPTASPLTMNKNSGSTTTTLVPTPKDTTPIALLVNYQLRRENAALLTQLQDILLAVKAADGERKEEMQNLVDEVQAVARKWDGASERVKGMVGVTAEMMRELRESHLYYAVM